MTNIYQTAYDLINQYVYGNTVVAGEFPDLMCVLGATAMCAFTVAVPFIVVKKVIDVLSR